MTSTANATFHTLFGWKDPDDPVLESCKIGPTGISGDRRLVRLSRSRIADIDARLTPLLDDLGVDQHLALRLSELLPHADTVHVGEDLGSRTPYRLYLEAATTFDDGVADADDLVHVGFKWGAPGAPGTVTSYRVVSASDWSTEHALATVGFDPPAIPAAQALLRALGADAPAEILAATDEGTSRRSLDIAVAGSSTRIGHVAAELRDTAHALGSPDPVDGFVEVARTHLVERIAVGRDGEGRSFVTIYHRA